MANYDLPTDDDKFGWGEFTATIAKTLLDRDGDTVKTSELVIGLTGPWGSGKSSIVKCLELHLKGATVIHFMPWMYSGSDDLVFRFLCEIAAAIGKSSQLRDHINKYASLLKPIPLVGEGISDLAKNMSERTLSDTFEELETALKESNHQLIVIIDDIDRLEPNQVNDIMRLVKSVGHLANTSYLLVYDKARVTSLLDNDIGNGAEYMEKIIQFEFSLPYLYPEVANQFLDDLFFRPIFKDEKYASRYEELKSIIIPHILSTPRDIKRIAQAWEIRFKLLAEDVNPVDLLGFLALETKYPDIVQHIKSDPDYFTDDSISRLNKSPFSNPEAHDNISPFKELSDFCDDPYCVELVGFLFPKFQEFRIHRLDSSLYLSRVIPLQSVLGLGTPPHGFNISAIKNLISVDSHSRTIRKKFIQWHKQDSLIRFCERYTNIYTDLEEHNWQNIWLSIFSVISSDYHKSDLFSYKQITEYAAVRENFIRWLQSSKIPEDKFSEFLEDLSRSNDCVIRPIIIGEWFSIFSKNSENAYENSLRRLYDDLLPCLSENEYKQRNPWPIPSLLPLHLFGEKAEIIDRPSLLQQTSNFFRSEIMGWVALVMYRDNYNSPKSEWEKFCDLNQLHEAFQESAQGWRLNLERPNVREEGENKLSADAMRKMYRELFKDSSNKKGAM